MSEIQDVIGDLAVQLIGPGELGKMDGEEAEAEDVHGIDLFPASRGSIQFAGIAFYILLTAPGVPSHAETQLQIVLPRIIPFVMIDHHPRILDAPAGVLVISLDVVLHGTRDLALLFLQEHELFLHHWLLVRHHQYVLGLVHERQIYG